ncbi:ABC transporter substrate-binding protein [Pseudorhodoferax sp.]|uniref:ABC transporter substrate-binding protein n=1 Tax=Pseudorhodoferax sp. TaxID=1993553 RepID=UPI0039E664F1
MHSIPSKLAGAAALAWLAAAAQAQDIPVTSFQAMTGAAAFAGANYQNSIRLAVEEFNRKGGVNGQKIRLIEHDTATDKGQAINLANQAISRDRAVLAFGPSTTAESVAVAPIFNDRRVPVLSFATSDAVLKFGPWSLMFQQPAVATTPQVAKYVLEKTPARKVVLVFDRTNEALIEQKSAFRDAFKAGGGTVVGEEAIVGTDSNFQPLATKIKSMDADAVYISALTEQTANVLLQLHQSGLSGKMQFIGSNAMASLKFVEMTGKAAEGSIAVADHLPGIDRPLNQAFAAAYKARYGVEADSWATIGYSFAQVGLAAIEAAGPNPTPEKVRDAYATLRDVPILGGSGLWNQTDRRPHFGAMVLVLKDGRFVPAP